MTTKQPRMSDAAVKAKTGKGWKEWFAILDKAGAKKMAHKEIADHLYKNHEISPWWGQMVTVVYEQDRGLRDRHEKHDGYQISVSRTIDVPLSKLYRAFTTPKTRESWLDEDGLVIRKQSPNKSMRVTWKDQKTSLEINFYSKAEGKSQVVVQHSKLPDAKAAAKMKSYWATALDKLRRVLE